MRSMMFSGTLSARLSTALTATLSTVLAVVLLTGAMITAPNLLLPAAPAHAVTAKTGPKVQIPGWGDLGAFVLSNGKNAYCIERSTVSAIGPFDSGVVLDKLPKATAKGGAIGTTPALTSAKKMRQLNYIIDTWGQTTSATRAAKVQTAVWMIRGDSGMGWWIDNLKATAAGKAIHAGAVEMIETAEAKAVAPVKPKAVSGVLSFALKPDGRSGQVAYPAGGVTSMTITNAKFTSTGTSTISSGLSKSGGARGFTVTTKPGANVTMKASAKWVAAGTKGWEPELRVYTPVASGDQRTAYATGSSTPASLSGTITASATYVPQPEVVPFGLSSQAQAAAEVGGTMTDTIIVTGSAAALPQPGSVDAIAYLQPVAGAPKYGADWEPIDDPDDPGAHLTWTQAELDELSAAERCVVQPVARAGRGAGRIPVETAGRYTTDPVDVKSSGTVYWVERYWQGSTIHRQGRCGVSNERTAIDAPAVVTRAIASVSIGDTATDTATVSGKLAADADYRLVFEAYRALRDAAGEPVCDVANRIFRSEPVTVRTTGDFTSPGFQVKHAHGDTIWWIETLTVAGDPGDEPTVISRGECALENETTRVITPEISTSAVAAAAPGESIHDTAIVTGDGFSDNPHARWEVVFAAYREAYADAPDADADDPDASRLGVPRCEAGNLIERTAAVPVTGPGSYRSPAVRVPAAFTGDIWWVEQLHLVEDGERTLFAEGECGLPNETTTVTGADVATTAVGAVAVGDEFFDTAIVGGTLASGDGISHELSFELYLAELDAERNPVCETGNLLHTMGAVPVTGPGEYESERVLAMPEHVGALYWVETLWMLQGDERIELHRGECGLLNETTIVGAPRVSTSAVAEAVIGEEFWDTAFVSGPLSERDGVSHEVTFELFRAHEDAAGAPVCTAENRLRTLPAVPVTGEGSYESERIRVELPEHAGELHWVETLWIVIDGERHALHRGECGLENETTIVPDPRVTTRATAAAGVGDTIFDTAEVTGTLPSREGARLELTFELYRAATGADGAAVCERGDLLRTTAAVPVTGPGTYASERIIVAPDFPETLHWVERLWMVVGDERVELHRGICGLENETTRVTASLPETGGVAGVTSLLGGGALLLLGGGAATLAVRRRRETQRSCSRLIPHS